MRYAMAVGAVVGDAVLSGVTWGVNLHPVITAVSAVASGVGLVMAAKAIAGGVFGDEAA